MKILYTIIFLLIGFVLGSFYNVLGMRIPKKENFIISRSKCPNCKHELRFIEMIPVLSYIFLKGKCKYCKHKISVFYPIIELFTGLLFAISFYSFGFSLELLLILSTVSFLMIVIVSDLLYLIIPDGIIIFFSLLVIIIKAFIVKFNFLLIIKFLGSGFLMFMIMYLLMKLGDFIFKKESLGGADVKLMFYVGMLLGPILSIFTIFLSALIALPIALFLYFKSKDKIIPYGPFILIALLLVMYFKIDLNLLNNLL